MGKKIIIGIGVFVLFIILLIGSIFYFHYDLQVVSVQPLVYDLETNQFTIRITKKDNLFHKNFSCSLYDENNSIIEKGKKIYVLLVFQ